MTARYIVGINLPMKSRCHESGVALIDEKGEILFAASEERFTRKKLDGDFPERSIAAMWETTGIKKEDVAIVAVPTLTVWGKIQRFTSFFVRERRSWIFRPNLYLTLWKMVMKEGQGSKIKNEEQDGGFVMRYYWRDFIKEHFPNAKIVFVDHHVAHAAGAYYTSPWSDSLILTIDGAGNLRSSIAGYGSKGVMHIEATTLLPHSVGTFWGSITKVCGFRSGIRHGGKVTGLAARGNATLLVDKMRKAVWADGLHFRVDEKLFFDSNALIPDWNSYVPDKLRAFLGTEASREDIAAAAQLRLEEVVVEVVKNLQQKHPDIHTIVLAGGVCANVLMNQKILETTGIENVYIFPAMSDGGLSAGAALYILAQERRENGSFLAPRALKTAYLGPGFTEKDVKEAIKAFGVKARQMQQPEKEVAALIHAGNVVAVTDGRMEYGPRALGNRSILYAAKEPEVNDWLNRRLNRSEFMPFAPVTLADKAPAQYIGYKPEHVAARYMTITYQCTDEMKKKSPACVHIDGTARPQVISKKDNPYYYGILKEYAALSGIPTLINTSYNMHEEPIVCTPEDAIRAFLESGINYLALGSYLLNIDEQPEELHKK